MILKLFMSNISSNWWAIISRSGVTQQVMLVEASISEIYSIRTQHNPYDKMAYVKIFVVKNKKKKKHVGNCLKKALNSYKKLPTYNNTIFWTLKELKLTKMGEGNGGKGMLHNPQAKCTKREGMANFLGQRSLCCNSCLQDNKQLWLCCLQIFFHLGQSLHLHNPHYRRTPRRPANAQ